MEESNTIPETVGVDIPDYYRNLPKQLIEAVERKMAVPQSKKEQFLIACSKELETYKDKVKKTWNEFPDAADRILISDSKKEYSHELMEVVYFSSTKSGFDGIILMENIIDLLFENVLKSP